jgi:hypothetical protein
MTLGTICVLSPGGRTALSPEAVTIEGIQHGFVVTFKITQRFRNSTSDSVDCSYIIPNNMKICLYETTFRLRGEVIKPRLERKAAAKEIFREAKADGRAAILSSSLDNGLIEFELGNLPAESFCEVEVDCGLVASSSGDDKLTFKFPFDTCTPSGSTQCVMRHLRGDFLFHLRNACPGEVKSISSNVEGAFDETQCVYAIDRRVDASALFVTTALNAPLQSRCLFAGSCACATAFLEKPELEAGSNAYNEFVFLCDCSFSMDGERIRQARECLALFVRSLPEGSFFNVVRFGTRYVSLFENSVPYATNSVAEALNLAKEMPADLGATNILKPLEWIFGRPLKGAGLRQVFVLTDGEVLDTAKVIDLCRTHRGQNRCFTVGIGAGADAGMVEGIADATAGRAVFVQAGGDLSATVIPQLELSMQPAFVDVSVLVENQTDAEVAPFPIGTITPKVSFPVYLRASQDFALETGILVTGTYLDKQVESLFEVYENCEGDESIARCLHALFAFETIRSLEHGINNRQGDAESLKERCVSVSLESGVLCAETAFVGFTNTKYRQRVAPDFDNFAMRSAGRAYDQGRLRGRPVARSSAPPVRRMAQARDMPDSDPWGEMDWDDEPVLDSCDADSLGDVACAAPSAAPCGGNWDCPIRGLHSMSAPRKRPGNPGSSAPPPQKKANPWRSLYLGDVTADQEIDGSWQNVEVLFDLIGDRIEPFNSLSGEADANAIFATIVAVAILRAKFQDRAAVLRLIEQKALTWLFGRCGDVETMIGEVVR